MIKPSPAAWQQGFAYALTFLVGGLVAKTLPLPSLSSGISVDPSWSPAVSFEALPTFSPGAVNLDFAMIAAGVALLIATVALSTKAFTKTAAAGSNGDIFGGRLRTGQAGSCRNAKR